MPDTKKTIYGQIFEEMENRIRSGRYPVGSMLPSERELCEEFSLNRVTLRRALNLLVEKGYIEKKPGRGTVVVTDTPSEKREIYIGYLMYADQENRLSDHLQANLFYQIEQQCALYDFNLIYKTIHLGQSLKDLLADTDLSYLILSSQMPDSILKEAMALDIPVLITSYHNSHFTSIYNDDFEGGCLAAKYLLQTGHRRIALLTGPHYSYTSRMRQAGFQYVMDEYSVSMNSSLIYSGNWEASSGHKFGLTIAAMKPSERPDAVFAFNDRCAIGLILGLLESGVSVPKDISVIGFDDTPEGATFSPALTSLQIDTHSFAQAVVQTIRNHVERRDTAAVYGISIPCKLIVRDSVRDRSLDG